MQHLGMIVTNTTAVVIVTLVFISAAVATEPPQPRAVNQASSTVNNPTAAAVTEPPAKSHEPIKTCRDRLGHFPSVLFPIHACAKCLEYLQLTSPAKQGAEFSVAVSRGFAELKSSFTGDAVWAEPGNPPAMATVCGTLGEEDCADWTACCQAAANCCQRQLNSTQSSSAGDAEGGSTVANDVTFCPMTWDGYSCVDRTPAGQTAVIQCPTFIKRFSSDNTGVASRQCWENASWFVNTNNGLEWTNYDSCHKSETTDHHTLLSLKLSLKGVSLALLIPSIAVFLAFRPLRSQLRIKLHVNLFASLTLTAVVSLAWEISFERSLLNSGSDAENFLAHHKAACNFLYVCERFLLTTTFSWMFCEGFYLTWLMLQSFRHLSSLLPFVIVGWGLPLVFCIIYIIVRATTEDNGLCWMTSAGSLEWLLDGPSIACIAVNLLFLLLIMRVMVRQLQSHNEQRSLMFRSLRALFILIPLFGLQQFLTLYRPRPDAPGVFVYDVVSVCVTSLQGAVVALLFCFFNGEVQGHLKDVWQRVQYKLRGDHRRQSLTRQSMSMTSSLSHSRHSSRPSLVSMDAITSVALAPIHLAATRTGGEDGGGGSWRVRVSRMEGDNTGDRDKLNQQDANREELSSLGLDNVAFDVSNPDQLNQQDSNGEEFSDVGVDNVAFDISDDALYNLSSERNGPSNAVPEPTAVRSLPSIRVLCEAEDAASGRGFASAASVPHHHHPPPPPISMTKDDRGDVHNERDDNVTKLPLLGLSKENPEADVDVPKEQTEDEKETASGADNAACDDPSDFCFIPVSKNETCIHKEEPQKEAKSINCIGAVCMGKTSDRNIEHSAVNLRGCPPREDVGLSISWEDLSKQKTACSPTIVVTTDGDYSV